MRNWLHNGGGVLFLTLTLPHDWGESCSTLMDVISDAFSAVFSGRPYRRDRERFGIDHYFRSWDATHGKNGWHPHLHAALFTSKPLTSEKVKALEESIFGRWSKVITQTGRRSPTREHGIRLEAARREEALASYLLKVSGDQSGEMLAFELTRGDLKQGSGRSPFQILSDFAKQRDAQDIALFNEWERATKGRHFSRWSRGARDALEVEESEAQIREREPTQDVKVIHAFTPEEWLAVTRTPGAMSRLLRVAEADGKMGLQRYIASLRTDFRRRRRALWSWAA